MTDFDLLVVGDCNPDLVMLGEDVEPVFGQVERVLDRGELVVGGSGSITACGAARLGLRTAFVGTVGDDAFGRFMLAALTDRGVDVSGCVVDRDRPTGVSVLLLRPDGADRAILTAPGTTASLTAEDVPVDLVAVSRHVHVSSYFLQTSLRPGLASLIDLVRSRGATMSIDPNWDPADAWNGGLHDLIPLCSVFLPNDAEATRITGLEVSEAVRALSDAGPVVAVKCGRSGALVEAGGEIVSVPAPAVEATDTTGAGDSFDAGFLTGFLAGWDPVRSTALACACGALSTRALGGTGAQPNLEEALMAVEASA